MARLTSSATGAQVFSESETARVLVVRCWRLWNELTLEQAARETGVQLSCLHRLEQGSFDPPGRIFAEVVIVALRGG